MSPLRLSILAVGLVLCSACDDQLRPGTSSAASASAEGAVLEAAEDEAVDAATGQQRATAQQAGERVAVPAGAFMAGSTPGDRGRDPLLEPAPHRVELGAFEIDRLPFPNDPRKLPRVDVSRVEAAKLCAERSGRLCSELEWERACRGPLGQPYAGATRWDPECGKSPETCASGFGVLAMGGAMRELTASDVEPIKNIKKLQQGAMAVRGARADAADVDHRCAHRTDLPPETTAADLGFRCCYGKPSDAAIASPKWKEAFQRADLPPSKLSTMLASIERLAGLADDVKYFREDNAIRAVKRRGERARVIEGIESLTEGEGPPAPPPGARPFDLDRAKMTTAPLLWQPVPGEEILLVTGRSAKDSFILALHRFPAEGGGYRYRVGAAFLMPGEPGPIVLAYQPEVRQRLMWLTCVGCYAESGNIRYRDENRVTITQQ
jgi:hypothetical protein